MQTSGHCRLAKNVVVCGDVEMTASVAKGLETVLQVHLEKNPLGSVSNSTHDQFAPFFVHVQESAEHGAMEFTIIEGQGA